MDSRFRGNDGSGGCHPRESGNQVLPQLKDGFRVRGNAMPHSVIPAKA